MQVLEGQQQGSPPRYPGHELHDGLAQPDSIELRISAGSRRQPGICLSRGQRRDNPGQVRGPGLSLGRVTGHAHEIAECVGPDGKRRCPTRSGCCGSSYQDVGDGPPCRCLQFLDEPRLADATLSVEQYGSAGATPRRPPGFDQIGEVLLSSYETSCRWLDRVLRGA